jgi:hypothetical protein
MDAGHITPGASQPDRDSAFYEDQHRHDLEALDRAADTIAHQAGIIDAQATVIAGLRREQSVLLLHARRAR